MCYHQLAAAYAMKGDIKFYGNQDAREMPTYGITEAAHYLSIPFATLRSWVVGRRYPTASEKKFFKPLIILPDRSRPLLSFMNLVEAHILNAICKKHNVALPKVRVAINYLSKELSSKHPLADEKLRTDSIDLFIETFGKLINLSANGQLAIREFLESHLQRIEHDSDGLAARLYPFTRTNGTNDPKVVVIDPYVSFGKPVLTGTGIPTAIVTERYKAGESMDELADDYGLPRLQIEEALRYELAA
jgi:uncharacterized protein (DUF433 family)